MSIKLALLKSGETIISDMKELVVGEKVQGYLLNLPHKISVSKSILVAEENGVNGGDVPVEVTLSPWMILSADKEIAVISDWVVTVVNPLPSIIEIYNDKIGNALLEESEHYKSSDDEKSEIDYNNAVFKSTYEENGTARNENGTPDEESEESYIE